MSKYQQYKDEYIFPHKHCPICTKMIEEDQDFCSPECEAKTKTKDKKQKKQIYIFVGIYAIAIVVFIILAFVL